MTKIYADAIDVSNIATKKRMTVIDTLTRAVRRINSQEIESHKPKTSVPRLGATVFTVPS